MAVPINLLGNVRAVLFDDRVCIGIFKVRLPYRPEGFPMVDKFEGDELGNLRLVARYQDRDDERRGGDFRLRLIARPRERDLLQLISAGRRPKRGPSPGSAKGKMICRGRRAASTCLR